MKLGVIARCDDRGLGNQTWEVCRHLNPERVLLITDPNERRFTQYPERFEHHWNTTQAKWQSGRLDGRLVRRWLRGLDVVYSAESPYDLRLGDWAADERVGLVLHANPEFVGKSDATVRATWWAATPWRLSHLPTGARVVPMPVAEPRITHVPADHLRFLHVAGWPAAADRNGTDIAIQAAVQMRTYPCEFIVRSQHRSSLQDRLPPHPVRVEIGNVADYWDLYRGADVLVMPRRYGGLCLPAQEAMAVGLPVVMPDISPNGIWPGPRVRAFEDGWLSTRAGRIPLYSTAPGALTDVLDQLANEPELLEKYRLEAREWARANSWDALRETWLTELERASM
jgi:Glycosyl transferases group 1